MTDVDPTPTAADLRLDLGRLLVKALDTGLSEAGWRKLALAGCRRALHAEADLAEARKVVDSLARRVAAQSELLSRRAEGGGK